MGGHGSGPNGGRGRKQLVEVCACLQVLAGGEISGKAMAGNWRMTMERHGDATFLELYGTKNGWKASQSIEVVSWKPRFGGKSAWLLCPRGGATHRKLYMPPNAAEYRCRQCWSLVYWTSQNAHFFDRGLFGAITAWAARKNGISLRQQVKEQMQDRKAETFGG